MQRKILLSALFVLFALTVQTQSVPPPAPITSPSDETKVEPNDDHQLFKAIERGDVGEAIKLLDAGADPNATEE
jgi:hypothetical protein